MKCDRPVGDVVLCVFDGLVNRRTQLRGHCQRASSGGHDRVREVAGDGRGVGVTSERRPAVGRRHGVPSDDVQKRLRTIYCIEGQVVLGEKDLTENKGFLDSSEQSALLLSQPLDQQVTLL